MEKKKIIAVGIIGLLLAVGLVLIGCDFLKEECPGNGDCTVTIKQDGYGLSVDYDSPRSTCGKSSTYDYSTGKYSGGCKVQNNIDNENRTYGKHGCSCK